MPPRPHARQRLPLACALLCVLFAGGLALHRLGRNPAPPAPPPRADPPESPAASPTGADPFAALRRQPGSDPTLSHAAKPAPRWVSPQAEPSIPWQTLRRAVNGETKEIDFTFGGTLPAARAVVTRIERRSEASYTLMGSLSGGDGTGSWSLARQDAIVVANFRLPDGGPYLEWRVDAGGRPVERRVFAELLPPCESSPADAPTLADRRGPTLARPKAPDAIGPAPVPPPDFGDDPPPAPELAVLVVYTPAAVAAVGGPAAMEALVYLALDETNAALADSLATPRLRLVHHQGLAYTETVTTIRTDLERLRLPSDGYLDEVGALRDLVGADLVSMIVVNDVSCGRAYNLVSNAATFSEYAFSVVAHDCVATNYSFSHEIAHNLGCQHAVGDDNGSTVSGQGIFPYAHGWRFTGSPPQGILYRTIMAQSPGLRVPFYSNPDLLVAGTIAGDPSIGDCVRTLDAIGPMASQWRNTPNTLYGDAVGQPGWIFQSGGDAPWTVQPIERRDGPDALQVGLVPDHGSSWIQTIRDGPLELEFYWKFASDVPGAALGVSVDGVDYGRIPSGNGWRRHRLRLATGSHAVRWTQTRGDAGDALDAVAWIDSLRAEPVPMVIHRFRTVGLPVEGIEIEFESIPFQDYVLEMTSDFQNWLPFRPIKPDDPLATTTDFRAAFPLPMPAEAPDHAAFRVRLVE